LLRARRRAEADAALETLKAQDADVAAYQVAETYAYRGEKGLAFAWLDRAYRQRDSSLSRLKTDLICGAIRATKRCCADEPARVNRR
jgi:serine/threonine-protein kinase